MKRATTWGFVVAAACGAALIRLSGLDILDIAVAAQSERVQSRPQVLQLGERPGDWVPFSARMIRVLDPGKVVVGKIYRASDGSTRNETGPSGGDVNVIGIKNTSERTYYIWTPTGGWESRPLELPGGKYIQPRRPEMPTGSRVAEVVEGFELVQVPTDPNGVTEYQAPRLNYLAVKTTMPCNNGQGTGCGLWLSEIEIGVQPFELFKPPAQ